MGRATDQQLDGLLRGAVGSLAGLAAMGLVMRVGSRVKNGGNESDQEDWLQRREALDDVSVVGPQARDDEPATEAVGRIAYHTATGHDPDQATRQKLGTAVHWGYGILLGGAYGALRCDADGPDLVVGIGYGTAAWAIGDEVMVPLLGLAKGPTAHPWSDHLLALGAHLAYGAATATATQALKRVM